MAGVAVAIVTSIPSVAYTAYQVAQHGKDNNELIASLRYDAKKKKYHVTGMPNRADVKFSGVEEAINDLHKSEFVRMKASEEKKWISLMNHDDSEDKKVIMLFSKKEANILGMKGQPSDAAKAKTVDAAMQRSNEKENEKEKKKSLFGGKNDKNSPKEDVERRRVDEKKQIPGKRWWGKDKTDKKKAGQVVSPEQSPKKSGFWSKKSNDANKKKAQTKPVEKPGLFKRTTPRPNTKKNDQNGWSLFGSSEQQKQPKKQPKKSKKKENTKQKVWGF